MVIVGILSWWYGRGIKQQYQAAIMRFRLHFDFFSLDLLAATLFSPFRQIDAGKVRGPLGVQLRAFFDQVFSRVIGTIVRLVVMIIGSLWLILLCILQLIRLTVWTVLPVMPFVGVALYVGGVIPWHL